MWDTIPSDEVINRTIGALAQHGIDALVVDNGIAAKVKVLEMLPEKAEVMTMSSQTLLVTGLTKEINESGKYDAVHAKLSTMNRETQGKQMQQMGAAPEWAIGSVHAVTQEGEVLVASNTGSQLPAYAYGSAHVIWVVGAQKIVVNHEEGIKRLYEHSLPLEDKRMKDSGKAGSKINKVLQILGEVKPHRLTLIFVKEVLGF